MKCTLDHPVCRAWQLHETICSRSNCNPKFSPWTHAWYKYRYKYKFTCSVILLMTFHLKLNTINMPHAIMGKAVWLCGASKRNTPPPPPPPEIFHCTRAILLSSAMLCRLGRRDGIKYLISYLCNFCCCVHLHNKAISSTEATQMEHTQCK